MNRFSTRYSRFLGGQNLLYTLALILFLGIIIWIYSQISFIFHPLVVIIETAALPIILAVIAYYLLRPFVLFLERRKVKRIFSILFIMGVLLGGIIFLISSIIPFLETQFVSLVQDLPDYLEQMGTGIDQWLQQSIFQDVYASVSTSIEQGLADIPSTISNYAGDTFEGLAVVVAQVTNIVVALITLPFILFYLLKEGEKFPKAVLRLFPPRVRDDAAKIFKDIDHQIGSYILGQLLVSLCIGVSLYIGFIIIGLDYALLLAAIASVTAIVPYLGPAIAITPALIIAVVTSPFMLVKLLVVWTVVQLLEGKFISPQIMGKRLRIHPVTVIFILLTAAHLLGVVGVILAIPSYAILKVIVIHLFHLLQLRFNKFADPENRYDIAYNREDLKKKN